MSILIFIVMLVVLIVGHEFGHLIVAKLSGMNVPEFGLGFPPKLWGKKIGETEYTLNALPFGGFVKIFGEDDADASDLRAFAKRPKLFQAATLLAGPGMNIVLGLLLSTLAFMIGVPTVASDVDAGSIKNPHVLIAEILPKSPAAVAGLKVGDEIVSISLNGTEVHIQKPEEVSTTIGSAHGSLTMHVLRNKSLMDFTLVPVKGIDTENLDHAVVGIAPALVGIRSLPLFQAFTAGVKNTFEQTKGVLVGLGTLVGHALTLSADLSSVAGPVGIVSLVGDASGFGVGSILALAALISINLGVVNLLPFPALDGGRLALLAVETVSRRKIPAKISNIINIAGFGILIVLMLAVTAHDIFRLVG